MINGAKKAWRWFSRTQVWRAWKQYGDQRGNRLAAATSFFGFLSMFPLIVLTAAVTGKLLNDKAVADLKRAIRVNLPGIGDNIDIDALIEHAGTIGLISAATLLLTGLGWIDSMRASIRSMHQLDDQPGNAIQLKLADLGALIGLGLVGLIATGASSVLAGLSDRIADALDLEGSWLAQWGLMLISIVVGILSGALLFGYLESAMPRIRLSRRVTVTAALVGGVVFYGAQKLGNLYVKHVIGGNGAYGTLAVPLALLVWIYLLTRIIMLIAAWAKEATVDEQARAARAAHTADMIGSRGEPKPGERRPRPATPTAVISQRKADKVSVAAGALLGATATAIAVTTARAARNALTGLLRR